ncbi:MAG: hypothetical protein SW833_15490 [Cyanobacteriota bacterium]|nr:hypothetical protein [Cyanobacteriota bacterium]
MKTIFVDTFYWVALINPGDTWYNRVISISQSLGQFKIVTTEEVLTEVLTFYSGSGARMRQRTITLIDNILQDDTIQVIEQNHDSFLAGFSLYRSRLDIRHQR